MSRPLRPRPPPSPRPGPPTGRGRPSRLAVALLVAALLATGGPRPQGGSAASGGEPTAAGGAILAGVEEMPLPLVWDRIHELRGRLREAPDTPDTLDTLRSLAGGLADLPPKTRFAGATLVLLALPRSDRTPRARARIALRRIAREEDSPALRIGAIDVLAERGRPEDVLLAVHAILDDEADQGAAAPALRIACHLALWKVDNSTDLYPLRQMLDHEEFGVRSDVALALASTGSYDEKVLSILRSLRSESSHRGERARLYLDLHARQSGADTVVATGRRAEIDRENRELRRRVAELEAARREGGLGDGLVDLVRLLGRRFVEPGRVREADLYVEAFRAVLARLDHHARFLTEDEFRLHGPRALGQYFGLGARMVKPDRNSPLVVVRSIPGGPAHDRRRPREERLLSRDRVLEIDGLPTEGMSLAEARRILGRKAPGDPIRLRIRRGGEELWLSFAYGTVEVPAVHHRVFPGRVGYVRLQYFGEEAAARFRREVEAIEEATGEPAGLIVDLRGNSGGLIDEAVRVVDLFVGGDETRPILVEAGPGNLSREEHLPTREQRVFCPVVVLIDSETASAAEVVAGALQRFGRATIVGERSYGKGVSQEFLSVPASVRALVGAGAHILLPTHYLYLWPGSRFHTTRDETGRPVPGMEGGIQPDVEARRVEDGIAPEELAALERAQHSLAMDAYIRRHQMRLEAIFEGRSDEDPARPETYPRLETLERALRDELDISLPRSRLLLAVRRVLLRHVEDESGEPLVLPREDRPLRTALLELHRQADIEGPLPEGTISTP